MNYKDKLIHLIVCFGICTIGTIILTQLGMKDKERAIAISSLLAMTTGLGKEMYDKYVKHSKFDVYDLIADFVGVCMSLVAMMA